MLTYPLNKIEYQATDAELYNCTRNSGLYSGSDFRPTVSGADNNVTIDIGVGWIRNSRFSGKVVCSKTKTIVDMGLPDSRLPRWDVVCIQFSKNKNATEIVVKKGTAASSPIMPIISQTENLYELYLCKVYRKAGALTISNADLTDLRLDPTVCGLMADSVTSVDTESINQQFTAFLEDFKGKIESVENSSGVMLISTYDENSNGIVDNAERLGGQLPSYYAKKTELDKTQQTADEAKANAFSLYTHTAGSLTGSGANGKFKATVSETVTKLNVNGVSCTIKSGSETQMELIAGCWYTFILDGTTVNFSGGGAGAGLNFKIVGGTTQPVSPKENTIWVNTSTAIREWQFSATQPTTRADGNPLQNGDVWVLIGGNNQNVSFNSLKKNGIVITPISCKQFVAGAWQNKQTKIYKNSKWNEFVFIVFSATENTVGIFKPLSGSGVAYGTRPITYNSGRGYIVEWHIATKVFTQFTPLFDFARYNNIEMKLKRTWNSDGQQDEIQIGLNENIVDITNNNYTENWNKVTNGSFYTFTILNDETKIVKYDNINFNKSGYLTLISKDERHYVDIEYIYIY